MKDDLFRAAEERDPLHEAAEEDDGDGGKEGLFGGYFQLFTAQT